MNIKWVLIVLMCCSQCASAQLSGFQYVSPLPNSSLNSRESNIIIRQGSLLDRTTVHAPLLTVTGSASGVHAGSVQVADDNKTIVFRPYAAYQPNETVTVTLMGGITAVDGSKIGTLVYSFIVSPVTDAMALSMQQRSDAQYADEEIGTVQSMSPVQTDSVPTDIPKLTIGTSNNPWSGKIFLANQSTTTNKAIGNYLMIFNNDGTINKYKKISKSANGFKMESNGDPSYNLKGSGSRVILDTAFAEIDTVQGTVGYKADGHDFLLLPNGHSVLIANDPQPIDMSTMVPAGSPDATVTGCVVQELDASNNLVFQWRSFDYLPITTSYFDLTLQTIDLTHQNALAVDRDGNILVSLRHLSAIVKINRVSGGIDWILGGKLNQFTFINEHASNAPTYFSYPHTVDVLPNGNITLYDNGTQHVPAYSRGVEYALDVQNKTATMVWEYRHSPDHYSDAMGSVQRLPNGNTLIGWGNTTSDGSALLTEVHPDNSIALEAFFPVGQFCYRACKYNWSSQTPAITVTVPEVLQGNTYKFKNAVDSTGISIKFNTLNAFTYASASVAKYNYSPLAPSFIGDAPVFSAYYFTILGTEITSFSGQVEVDLRSYPAIGLPQKTVVYARPLFSELFQPVPTRYDSVNKMLVFTTSDFGEFAFGIPQSVSSLSPVPLSPKNGEYVNGEASIVLTWGIRGLVQTSRLQIATDSLFTSPAVDKASLAATSYSVSTLSNNTGYYWRANIANSAGTSAWSSPAAFQTASPFVKITYPNGSERISPDSTYAIRWQSNIHDTLRVLLMKGGVQSVVIADSIVSGTNALLWKVASATVADTSYKIKIVSVSRSTVTDMSDKSFTIGRGTTAVASMPVAVTTFQLSQNYPNPFNPSTVISFDVPVNTHVSLRVYDILGKEVRTLVDARKDAGSYRVTFNASDLPGGVYIYRIQAGDFVQAKKLTLLK